MRDVLEGYENILKNIPRRIDSKDRRLRRADHHIGLAQSKHSLMVHLLVIDIIATGSAGAYILLCISPSCYLQLLSRGSA